MIQGKFSHIPLGYGGKFSYALCDFLSIDNFIAGQTLEKSRILNEYGGKFSYALCVFLSIDNFIAGQTLEKSRDT